MRRLGVGLIGAGAATQAIHLPTLATLTDRFHIAHVFDVDPATAAEVATRAGARCATSLDEPPRRSRCRRRRDLQSPPVPRRSRRGSMQSRQAGHPVREAAGDDGRTGRAHRDGHERRWRAVGRGRHACLGPRLLRSGGRLGRPPQSVRAVRSTIYLPPNSRMTALATDLFPDVSRRHLDESRVPGSRRTSARSLAAYSASRRT